MSEPPRRRRPTGWAWVYLALFGSDGGEEPTNGSASDAGNSDTNDGLRRSDP